MAGAVNEGKVVRDEAREVTRTYPVGLHRPWEEFWFYPEEDEATEIFQAVERPDLIQVLKV